ncbi:uncharacterized protein BDZ99DRAFT_495811 [Mytilinidion resinicola]|uniref:Uncharacterized protein n=1 Tax=Mytilinidion resinicola TaxID=574789 RepID=A0A6A6YZE1_9PEZI|nr:uncharacterized protein BDZ99DRAFT_495811 [Mytilinidion resinicola]KAF2814296.1 hypothetical protein BDZ99DRAFT_495811 [Mytilinidion resinicola]
MASTDNNEQTAGMKRKAETSESMLPSKIAKSGDDVRGTDSEYESDESEESNETEIITTPAKSPKISHELYPFKRIDAHPHLPATNSPHHAHIVEASDSDNIKLSLADGIATVLWNYNSKALEIFLDPKYSRLEFTVKYLKDSEQFNYAIIRNLNMVKAGMYRTRYKTDQGYQGGGWHDWKNLAEARINYSGAWEYILGRVSCHSLGAWWGKGTKGLHMVGIPKRHTHDRTVEDEEEGRAIGSQLASTMISQRVWAPTAEVTIAFRYNNMETGWVDLV